MKPSVHDKYRIYMVPGMGCDARLFTALLRFVDVEVVEFLPPLKGERLPDYAKRMASKLDISRPFILGGVSFGGMVAAEMAKHVKPEMVIFISTSKTGGDFPLHLKFFRFLPVHRILSGKMLKAFWPRSPFKMGIENRSIMLSMKADCDPRIFKWSMREAINFRNRELPNRWIHLHGTKDLLLPGMYVKSARKVKGGDHVMVLNRAEEIALIISEEIGKMGIRSLSDGVI